MIKHKILIVEDETILRDAYAFVLRRQGYQISVAANGRQAIKEMAKDLPDLILLDWLMPVMNGEQFLIQSDVLNKHKTVKVIVYSNLSDRETVDKMTLLGIHGHILKSSMAPRELIEYIHKVLSLKA